MNGMAVSMLLLFIHHTKRAGNCSRLFNVVKSGKGGGEYPDYMFDC